MRADVKLGLVASGAVILIAGWFFVDQDASKSAIPILDRDPDLALLQPEALEREISLPSERPSPDTLAATPDPETPKPSPPTVIGNEDKSSGLAGLFETERGSDLLVEEQPAQPSENPIAVATFAPPAPTPEPDAPRMETHTVKPGDTMAELARRYYGDARYLKPLVAANAHIGGVTALAVGDVINLPDIEPIQLPPPEEKPTTTASRTHTVAVGDTLYRIALSRLGDASRWEEIYELNKDAIGEDSSALEIGQVLDLPVR